MHKWRYYLYDTSLLPTQEMREAMYQAEVGDDIYNEDPTMKELEAESAAMMGKEAAIFIPSGTMGNLIAMLAQTRRGDEVILEAESHSYYYETGGMANVGGLMPRLVQGKWGILDPDEVRKAIRPKNIHHPHPTLLCVENTHNRGGGTITTPERMDQLRAVCNEYGLKMHLDGARIFNAAVALEVPINALTRQADTVMFCLSKGLGAPVGSILAGNQNTILEAIRIRKMLGGGMRRNGFLAAAGLVALRTGINRLVEDHRLAKILASGLNKLDGIRIDLQQVQTNMVMIEIDPTRMTAVQFAAEMKKRDIKVSARPPHTIQMVTHRDLNQDDVQIIVSETEEILKQSGKSL